MSRRYWFPVALIGACLLAWLFRGADSSISNTGEPPRPVADGASTFPVDPTAEAEQLAAERARLDASLWAVEREAQRHEEVFVRLWDTLRSSTNRYTTLTQFPLSTLNVRGFGAPTIFSHDIGIQRPVGPVITWSTNEFCNWLSQIEASGIKLIQFEFHHQKFVPAGENGSHSTVSMVAHAHNAGTSERFILTGDLNISWQSSSRAGDVPIIADLSATNLTVMTRKGNQAFTNVALPYPMETIFHPIAVYDLNRDGLAEILLPANNVVYWNRGGMRFESTNLFDRVPEGIKMKELDRELPWLKSVIADFTRDGLPDILLTLPNHGIFLYAGNEQGKFTEQPVKMFSTSERFYEVSAVTCGDINGDGWIDVWLGQYRRPYDSGQMPTPFYDANDGYPSFLLLNHEGRGFEDITIAAGLGEKRRRRNYSASLIDLDEDGDLDLLTVNDFSGIDAFLNDGKGYFTERTGDHFDVRANFGMGHVFADFDNDARLDLYVTGMSSTTARRLDAMGLRREDFPEVNRMRKTMAYGNRIYLGQGDGKFRQPAFLNQVARTGWAWGVSAFDFGNDGTMDLYVANGHVSGKSCSDYCTRFWTHDVYVQNSLTNNALAQVFQAEMNRFSQASWNGFEKNVLFINKGGQDFVNAGFLFDVAFESDSRNVISEDFDHDGRMDLLFVVIPSRPQGSTTGSLQPRLLRNVWPDNGNWIGVQLRGDKQTTPCGARVTIKTANRDYVGVVVSGDSHWCQHSTTRHFGIGDNIRVDQIVVTWPNGLTTRFENPPINQYHLLTPSGPEPATKSQ